MNNINSLSLPEEFESYRDANSNELKTLAPLGKINIFVGSNNSGKSRFLRLLSIQESYQIGISDIELTDVNSELKSVFEELRLLLTNNGVIAAENVSIETIDRLMSLPTALSSAKDAYGHVRDTFTAWSNITRISSTTSTTNIGSSRALNSPEFPAKIKSLCEEGLKVVNRVPKFTSESNFKRVYIPILRGLRPLDAEHTDYYQCVSPFADTTLKERYFLLT